MERGEPALVPQWYRLASWGTFNNALQTSSFKHLDKIGIEIGSRNILLGDQDRNLQGSLSSNGYVNNDKGSYGKSLAYSSFRRSRDKHQEKGFEYCDRENWSLVGIGLDHHYSSLGVRAEKDALSHSQSMIAGRQVDSWPKRPGCSANNSSSGASVIGSICKIAFEKDFPSL